MKSIFHVRLKLRLSFRQLCRRDCLPDVPLAVFGDVDEQADERDWQLFSADVADYVEVFRVRGAHDFVVAVECGVDAGYERFGRLIVIVFAAERRELSL